MEDKILQSIYEKLNELETKLNKVEQIVNILVKRLPITNNDAYTYEKYLKEKKDKSYNSYFTIDENGVVVGWDSKTKSMQPAEILDKD